MADSGDRLQSAPGTGRLAASDRERFLTFALTAADMLLEVSPEGRIEFAAGAFQNRLGEPPEAWLGRPVERVVVLPDRAAFDGAFSTLLARDRLPPTSSRLADAAGTPISIAGLRMPGTGGSGRFSLAVSALPRHPVRPPAGIVGGGDAVRDAALRRAEGAAELLSLIEIAGPDGRAPQPGPVAAIVDEALSAALRPDSVAGALAPGGATGSSRARAPKPIWPASAHRSGTPCAGRGWRGPWECGAFRSGPTGSRRCSGRGLFATPSMLFPAAGTGP
jgi:PAS domain-containing protein